MADGQAGQIGPNVPKRVVAEKRKKLGLAQTQHRLAQEHLAVARRKKQKHAMVRSVQVNIIYH